MTRKTLCINADGYPYKGNSEFSFVKELCVELTKQGVEVTVVAPQSILANIIRRKGCIPLHYVDRVDNGGKIEVYRPLSWSLGGRFAKYQYKSNCRSICRLIRRKKLSFDVYYGHFWHCAYQLYPIAEKQGSPLFVASGESHIFLADTYKTEELKDFLSYISKVICVSSKNRDESIGLGFCDKEKCIVLPNGFNESIFYPMNQEEMRKKHGLSMDAFLVAFLGAFIERKGADRVSDAIKLTGDTTVKGIYIGKPQEGNAPHEPDPETVAFKGYVPHDELSEWLCCADVFVLPTYQEGCCNAIVEAIACGLPVISSDRTFNYDILDKTNSILVNPQNIEEISEAIKRLKRDSVLRASLAKGSLMRSSQLSIKSRAAKIKNILFR